MIVAAPGLLLCHAQAFFLSLFISEINKINVRILPVSPLALKFINADVPTPSLVLREFYQTWPMAHIRPTSFSIFPFSDSFSRSADTPVKSVVAPVFRLILLCETFPSTS